MEIHENFLPKKGRIHLMGICGVGMSSLAGMLKKKGYEVTGSDQNIYPPISTALENLSIPVMRGYKPGNLHPAPDLVIVGNVITRVNPEAVELFNLGIPYLSMPQALKKFAMEGKKSIVVSGTHGKTTTSALTAWILETAGMDPSFMIGGIPKNFGKNFKLGSGEYFVIEGDEYDTAFFDKRPKFIHYDPYITAITSIEFDHADIYKDITEIQTAFRNLIELIPQEGTLCVNRDDSLIVHELEKARCNVFSYAFTGKADLTITSMTTQRGRTWLTITRESRKQLKIITDLYGKHNMYNLLAAISIASQLNIKPEFIMQAADSFNGVKRRLERRGNYNDILVIDDFAHHPTAVKAAIEAVKGHYQNRRLIAVFEPRSNSSRRNIFQTVYASSFDVADIVVLPDPPMMEKIPLCERFSSSRLALELRGRGVDAYHFSDNDQLLESLLCLVKPGDAVLIMSNGAFDHIQERLLRALAEKTS